MNKRFAWELFKNTGNIDAYMLMKDVEYSEQLSNNIDGNLTKTDTKLDEKKPNVKLEIGDTNGDYKNQRDSYKNS